MFLKFSTRNALANLFFLLAVLPFTNTVFAIVNVETNWVYQLENGVSGNVNYDVTSQTGNTERDQWGAATTFNWKKNEKLATFIFSRNFATAFENKVVDNSFAYLRYIYTEDTLLSYEAFTQYEQDAFRALIRRELVGGGYRFSISAYPTTYLNVLGLNVMQEHEVTLNEQDKEISDYKIRGNFYWNFKIQDINKDWRFSNVIYYQPDLNDTSDVRAYNQMSFETKLRANLSLVFLVQHIFDSKPPEPNEEFDWLYSSRLQYNF